jgi:hypothetical protein
MTEPGVRYWWSGVVAAAALVTIFAVMVVLSFGYPRDARLFPLIVCAAGLCFGIGILIVEIRRRPVIGENSAKLPEFFRSKDATQRWTALMAAPLYGLLLLLTGFYLASGITLVVLPYFLGYRRFWFLVGLAVVTIAVVNVLFSYVMDMSMPKGVLDTWFLETFVYDD